MQIIGGGEKGGSLNHLITLTKGIIKKGYQAEIVCFLDDIVAEEARKNDLPVTVFPMKHIFDLRAIKSLYRYIEQKNPHIIHTHGIRANFIGRLAARKTGKPIVTTVHSSMYHDYSHTIKKTFYHRIEKLTRPYTTKYIAVADSLKKELIGDGVPEDKIKLIYNGLSPNFPLDEKVEPFLRSELKIGEDIPILISIGRMEAVKNQEMLLEIFATLKQNKIPFHGVLAGDGPLLPQLKEQAEVKGIKDDVSFLGFRKDICGLLSESDVFLLTSNMEGMPITILEAMAARTPVVLSDVGGMPEIVRLAKNGYIVPVNDVEQFAARIQEIIVQPDLKQKLADNGYTTLINRFTSEQFIDNTLEVYHGVKS